MGFNIAGIAINQNFSDNPDALAGLLGWELQFEKDIDFETASGNWKEEGICDLYFSDHGTIVFISIDLAAAVYNIPEANTLTFAVSESTMTSYLHYYEGLRLRRTIVAMNGSIVYEEGEKLDVENVHGSAPGIIWAQLENVSGRSFWSIKSHEKASRYRIRHATQSPEQISGAHLSKEEGYDEIGTFSEGLASVKWNGRYGYIDDKHKLVIPALYESARAFKNGIAAVRLHGKYGFISKDGTQRTGFVYEDTWGRFIDGIAYVRIEGKWCAIDSDGRVLSTFDVDQLWDILEADLVLVEKGGKWGGIDRRNFALRVPFQYDEMPMFSEGLALVSVAIENNGAGSTQKISFIDLDGKELVPFIYDDGSFFGDGLAPVKLGDKWGFINKEGTMVIPLQYDWAESFSGGFARVKKGAQYIKVDVTGTAFTL